MTKDDLIRMADLAGYDVDEDEVYAPASGRYGLDPRLEHFAKLVAGYALRYECSDMSKKTQNVDTSEKCVHESDKSIHEEIERLKAEIKRANKLADYRLKLLMQMPEPWDTSDMAHRAGGLNVEESIKDSNT